MRWDLQHVSTEHNRNERKLSSYHDWCTNQHDEYRLSANQGHLFGLINDISVSYPPVAQESNIIMLNKWCTWSLQRKTWAADLVQSALRRTFKTSGHNSSHWERAGSDEVQNNQQITSWVLILLVVEVATVKLSVLMVAFRNRNCYLCGQKWPKKTVAAFVGWGLCQFAEAFWVHEGHEGQRCRQHSSDMPLKSVGPSIFSQQLAGVH